MTNINSSGVEPGGMDLSDSDSDSDCTYNCECPACGSKDAKMRNYEALDGGCINQHVSIGCGSCGHFEDSRNY